MSNRIFFLIVCGFMSFNAALCWSQEGTEARIQAKIGVFIKSGDRLIRAKSQTRLKMATMHNEAFCSLNPLAM